jgi:hypothetical protein
VSAAVTKQGDRVTLMSHSGTPLCFDVVERTTAKHGLLREKEKRFDLITGKILGVERRVFSSFEVPAYVAVTTKAHVEAIEKARAIRKREAKLRAIDGVLGAVLQDWSAMGAAIDDAALDKFTAACSEFFDAVQAAKGAK